MATNEPLEFKAQCELVKLIRMHPKYKNVVITASVPDLAFRYDHSKTKRENQELRARISEKMVKAGYEPGTSDLLCLTPSRHYNFLCLEGKRLTWKEKNGKLVPNRTPIQKKNGQAYSDTIFKQYLFLESINNHGAYGQFYWGSKQGFDIFERYMNNEVLPDWKESSGTNGVMLPCDQKSREYKLKLRENEAALELFR